MISHERPGSLERPYHLLSPEAMLEPTEFALPLDVRRATACAPEAENSFAPTGVQTASGKRFILNSIHVVFQWEDVRRCDLKLPRDEWHWDTVVSYEPARVSRAACFFADPCEGCEESLRRQVSS